MLFGVDGGEWQVINQMISGGELPNFARIKRDGAWGHLINPGMSNSPAVWTTIATGHFPRTHGVLNHVFPFGDEGPHRPVTSELRQIPALWNVATHYGLSSTVIGYFVTHPPERINGVMVSPMATAVEEVATYPEGAIPIDKLRYAKLGAPHHRRDIWAPFFGWEYDEAQANDPDSPYRSAAATVVERNLEYRIIMDEFVRLAVGDLVDRPTDLFIAYYRVPDFMSHSLWKYYDPEAFDPPPSENEMKLFGESVKQSYRFVDQALGELLDSWDGKANIIVVSDHGFGPAAVEKMKDPDAPFESLNGDHRPNGILLATGPAIEPGEIEGLTVMEMAPTLAYLAGMPVAGDMPGSVATGLFRETYLVNHPIQSVRDYSRVAVDRIESSLDEAGQAKEMDALRGLGYVGGDVEFGLGEAEVEYDFWEAAERLVAGHIAGEILYYLIQDDFASADSVLRTLSEKRPDAARTSLFNAMHTLLRLDSRLPEGTLDSGPIMEFLQQRDLER